MALQEEFESQGNWLFKYRSLLPIVILIAGIAYYSYLAISNIHPASDFFGVQTYAWICFAVGVLGQLIRAYTVGHTPKNTSGRNTSEGQIADVLNQTGIYSAVRHPLYVGNFFMWLAICMLVENLWFNIAFILSYYLYYERIMYAEEQFLRRKFGKMYEDWAARTPAFIPSFKNWSTAALSFSFKKVIKKEKNGILALCALFFLFKLLERSLQSGAFDFQQDVWFWMTVAASIYYIIVKVIRKSTSLLNEKNR